MTRFFQAHSSLGSSRQSAKPAAAKIELGDWQGPLRTWLQARWSDEVEGLGSSPAFLVGGVIRDAILGLEPGDIDIALSSANLLVAAQPLGKLVNGTAVLLDAERRLVRVAAPHLSPPHVDLSVLRGDPSTTPGKRILADLAERDFTCNTLALPLEAGFQPDWARHIIDPFGGQADLEARRLRAVSDGIFRDDPLRLLRAARLAAELQVTIEPSLEEAILQNAVLITQVSPERIRDELVRLLLSPDAASWLERLDHWDLLCRVLPELAPGKGIVQPFFHHWDVFQHNLKAVEALEEVLAGEVPSLGLAVEPDWQTTIEASLLEDLGGGRPSLVALKLATLLHDIGKPATKTMESSGRARFFGHAELGARMAAEAMERLRFSRREVEAVHLLVEEHLRPTQMGHPPSDRALYRFFRDLGDQAFALLLLHLADARATHGPSIEPFAQEGLLRRVGNILRWHFTSSPEMQSRLINGHELMSTLDLVPGPLVGQLLEAIEEAHALGQVSTHDEALAYAAGLLQSKTLVGGRDSSI